MNENTHTAEQEQERSISRLVKLPPAAKDRKRTADNLGQASYIILPYGKPNYTTAYNCSNCYDQRLLGLMVVISSGHSSVPYVKPGSGYVTTTALDPTGGTWAIVSNSWFDCHICNDQNRQADYYLQASGLLPTEYDWNCNYIAGMEGKDIALSVALELQQQLPSPEGWVLYYGDYGVGKSGLLKSLVAYYASRGINARYVRAADYLQYLRNSYNGNDTEQAIQAAYGATRLLAIDEVDRISDTDWAKEQIFTLLDKRYNDRTHKATVIATNQAPDELWGYLASRALDGMRIEVAGKSLRG